jgi:UDP-N-acetylglucosamine--N-acetylmuramyl-(pentapeptide) pyrophosphoryl-undecaprenol N-acetylglucosamine transferase
MKILFTGGGTAGHVTPNVALIEKFREEDWECIYVGSKHGIEKDIIAKLGIPYHGIASGKLRRYFDWKNFTDPFLILFGVFQSLVICLRVRPDVVFSKGGFVAVPIVFAAWLFRIPIICHESDVTPGLANRLCFPFASKICVNFSETKQYVAAEKVILTGTPIRRSLVEGSADRGRRYLAISSDKPVLLIFGGSLGARVINSQVRSVIGPLSEKFIVVHVVGAGNVDDSLKAGKDYIQTEYLMDEFGDVLASADLVIARAGANSIYELLVTRKPHILIPLSAKASRGDQLINARTFARAGYSHVIEEDELNDDTFLKKVDEVFTNRKAIAEQLVKYEIPDSVSIISE